MIDGPTNIIKYMYVIDSQLVQAGVKSRLMGPEHPNSILTIRTLMLTTVNIL